MILEKKIKVGDKGQIIIPPEIRKKVGIKPNQTVKIKYVDGEIYIKRGTLSHEKEFFDLISNSRASIEDWEEIQKERIL